MSTLLPSPPVAVVVVAAGSGTRLGAGGPKAFVGIDDRTILRHCLDGVFAARPAQVVVVAPADRVGEALVDTHEAAGERAPLACVVAGGATRQASVAAGLAALWPGIRTVLVHDAARALAPGDLVDRVVDAVERTGWGVVPVLPVVDTIKRVDGERITGVVDRAELAAAQTPQGFRRDVLDAAYRVAQAEYTDDSALVAAAGHPIASVEGSPLAFKITTPADLERARSLIPRAPAAAPAAGAPAADALPAAAFPAAALSGMPRVGIGTDVHAFGGEGPLWLAGLEWPGEPALSGHSDGDAVAHAVVDALLSAAGLGDIGGRFGVDRPEFAGAHAGAFLADTLAHLADNGWAVASVAVQVQSARPKLAPRRREAEAVLSEALGGAPVSVSATTTDGLGFTGAGEGVQAFAVAVVHRA
ncbi:2-C-methyl-D-erythritol 4-phosphate cytidylyltransferase [Microbacterium sp. NPDC055683]